MLWVDKHRPHDLEGMDYHSNITKMLLGVCQKNDFPHLLFYGPSGAGKKTRVLAMLHKIYGDAISRAKVETRSVKAHDKATPVDIEVTQSPFHLEVSPSDVGNKDFVIVQSLIKEMAQNATVTDKPFRVLVIDDAELLTHQVLD